MSTESVVFIAILAKNKEYCIREYLNAIASQDYPKKSIVVYIRANNCEDNTIPMIKRWVSDNKENYLNVIENYEDIDEDVINKGKGEHDWDVHRFNVLGKIRQDSVTEAINQKADYYFVVDCDNFLTPDTLSSLISCNMDYVGPMLITTELSVHHRYYGNYHFRTSSNGYYAKNQFCRPILHREITGLIECDVVHTCYLIKISAISRLRYLNPGDVRHEYVIWSESARKAGIKQYIDNRKFYGYVIFLQQEMEVVRKDSRIMT